MMNIKTENLSKDWILYTLTNENKMKVKILNYGGIITEILAPDNQNNFENVVLGFKDYENYKQNDNYLGAITGRVAGRIQDASFTIGNKEFQVEANEGVHHLHGGTKGFHQVLWKSEPFQTEKTIGVKLSHISPHGEGGYPGQVEVTVTYTLNNANELSINYHATTDHTTPLTITNHSYFNLSGNLKDDVKSHIVTIDSDQFVELDEALIPTGKIINVEQTPFDFRKGRKINDGVESTHEQNKIAENGYDHYFIFNHKETEVVKVFEPKSRRQLTVKTNQPGMVMYTANALDQGLSLAERKSEPYLGICLETQGSPASLHHEGFPKILLPKGEVYEKETIFSFQVKQ